MTRLTENDIAGIEAEWATYERRLEELTGDDLLTLAEARKAIRLPEGVTARDDDLSETYIPAVTAVVEDVVGPVVQRPVTFTLTGPFSTMFLPSPALSITSVTVDGTALAATEYSTDLKAGMVRRTSTYTVADDSDSEVTVAYVAGLVADTGDVPAPIKLAARIILAGLWQTREQGFRPEFGTAEESQVTTTSGFLISRYAYSLLRPYEAHFVSVA